MRHRLRRPGRPARRLHRPDIRRRRRGAARAKFARALSRSAEDGAAALAPSPVPQGTQRNKIEPGDGNDSDRTQRSRGRGNKGALPAGSGATRPPSPHAPKRPGSAARCRARGVGCRPGSADRTRIADICDGGGGGGQADFSPVIVRVVAANCSAAGGGETPPHTPFLARCGPLRAFRCVRRPVAVCCGLLRPVAPVAACCAKGLLCPAVQQGFRQQAFLLRPFRGLLRLISAFLGLLRACCGPVAGLLRLILPPRSPFPPALNPLPHAPSRDRSRARPRDRSRARPRDRRIMSRATGRATSGPP